MDPITLAMTLAPYAPKVIKWLTGSDKAEDAAEAVVGIAQTVTGKPDPDEALSAIKADPALQLQFRQAVMANEADLDKAFLADVADARKRDLELVKAGQRNYRADAMFVLAVLVIVWLVVIIWKSPELPEYTKGIFTLLIGRFTGYLDAIYNFEWGTTRINRTKDETISKLADK